MNASSIALVSTFNQDLASSYHRSGLKPNEPTQFSGDKYAVFCVMPTRVCMAQSVDPASDTC